MTTTLSPPASSAERLSPDQGGARPRSHWHLLISLASFAAVMLTSFSLNNVIFGWTWFTPVGVTVGTALFFMALARVVRLPAVFPPVIGVLALGGSLMWQFFPGQSNFGVFPGEGFTGRFKVLLGQAENTVVSQVAPVLPGVGIFLVTCAGIGLIAILVDTMANTLRMPATAGLALLAILVVSAVVRLNSVGVPAFLAAVAGYLLLLGCAQWREARHESAASRELSGGHLSRGLTIGAVALTVSVILPLVIPGFNSGAFPQGARVNLWGTASGLNPIVTLGNDLRNPTGFGRITYATNADRPLYLRSVTLEDFSGQRWEPDQRLADRVDNVNEMGTEPVRAAIDSGENVITRISADTFTSPWLLAPYAPVGIESLDGRWTWDPANLSILAADGGSTAQQEYVVRSAEPVLTRERLERIPPVAEGAVSPSFLELPEDTPGIIRDVAASLTGEIANPYDKAIAIQTYLRGPEFIYSIDAPVDGGYDGNSLDVMARFLESKSGYCVHYAGTMAVLARLAGIPSRVAVGYSPGTATGETVEGPGGAALTEFSVNSKDAHAWPELYFEGVGWVQFEPTPSRGVVPDYALAEVAPGAPPVNPGNLNPSAGPVPPSMVTPSPEAPEAGGGESAEATSQRTWVLGTSLVIVVVLVAFAPLMLRTLRTNNRRRKVAALSQGAGTATITWAETTEIAGDYGFPAEATDTPRTFENRLRRDSSLSDSESESLTRLRRAYEVEEYSGHRSSTGPAAVCWEDVEAVTSALRKAAPFGVRVMATVLPRSLWKKFQAQGIDGGTSLWTDTRTKA
ncbi:DUF3488 and transglutaminase-like domain-containing protein [Arthrobacter sp. H5]|uniref:transglutaminase family protein n=1 Tax=Arthrobacter sp. H5 TaxID=1267973 RepID=UPI0004BAA1E3|nr:DUF3488 and transglutaminase-like domain-containing protein [Arthrobacter sp. H5]